MKMIKRTITKWLKNLPWRKGTRSADHEHPQVALPLRADLPLRERSRALVAIPAQINGARMGSGKF